MKRFAQLVLVLSLALNIGFALAWLGHRRAPLGLDSHPRHELGRRGNDGAGHPQRSREAWASRRARWLDHRLHLDPLRREKLRSSLLTLEPEMVATRRALGAARKEFSRQLQQPIPERDSILIASEKISQLQARLDSLVTEALLREAELLRPEERRRPEAWFPHPRGMKQGGRR